MANVLIHVFFSKSLYFSYQTLNVTVFELGNVMLFFYSVMLYKIYAQLKASKILASTVQNPDLCPDRVDRNSARKNIFFFYQQNIFYLFVLT